MPFTLEPGAVDFILEFLITFIYCSDFRCESNGIFVLGVGFFFFRQISIFYLANFDGFFLYHSKSIVVLGLNLKNYFTCDHFLVKLWGFKISILANFEQLKRDIFCAINA